MSVQLPVPIERYVQIANSGAPEASPECFAADAIVRDVAALMRAIFAGTLCLKGGDIKATPAHF